MSVTTLLESNAAAKRNYTAMSTNLQLVLAHLPVLEKLIRKMDKRVKGRGWHMATPEELQAFVNATRKAIGEIVDQAKQYEAELVSNDWKV